MDLCTVALREFDIFLGFSWRDLSVTIVPGAIFALGAFRTSPLPLTSNLHNLTFLLTWLTFYIYFFTLSNQITGVDEDRVNKPGRPIPSGKVTLEGAKVRWALTLACFLALAAYDQRLLPETIAWVITTAFLSLTPGGSHWFGKNCMALTPGTWSLLSASWKAISPPTPEIEGFIMAIAIWAGCVAQIADLRDIKGDAIIGRRTLPLAFGDAMSRQIIAYVFLPICYGVLWTGGVIALAPLALTVAHLFLAGRVLQAGGSRYDHKTYMMVTYIFCLILALIACRGLEIKLPPHAVWWWLVGHVSKPLF